MTFIDEWVTKGRRQDANNARRSRQRQNINERKKNEKNIGVEKKCCMHYPHEQLGLRTLRLVAWLPGCLVFVFFFFLTNQLVNYDCSSILLASHDIIAINYNQLHYHINDTVLFVVGLLLVDCQTEGLPCVFVCVRPFFPFTFYFVLVSRKRDYIITCLCVYWEYLINCKICDVSIERRVSAKCALT